MLHMLFMKHTAESCPMHEEKIRKLYMEFYDQMGPLMKKYGIKMVGAWSSMSDHLSVAVLDVPSQEAMVRFWMEPAAMAFAGYLTIETRPVMTLEETMKFLK
ncbi:MAG TPA: DUF3303 family protein [candidate division Zixibacteria bacterium]|nr:DUF3303 family protein [candidate division Zixibacteria bacterium]